MMSPILLTEIEAAKAHGILTLSELVDEYGLERVERWLQNLAATKAAKRPPSPGTISDPRR
jgi:hypothetical protein